MPNTKRDKHDEVADDICNRFAYSVPDNREEMARMLRSAFPPPAEDARQCAVNITGLDPDAYKQGCPAYLKAANALSSAAAEIESFAQSRVEPWREAIKKIAYDEVSPLGDVCPEDYDRLRNIAHALLSDSPAKEADR